jgi:hypothetical protein
MIRGHYFGLTHTQAYFFPDRVIPAPIKSTRPEPGNACVDIGLDEIGDVEGTS